VATSSTTATPVAPSLVATSSTASATAPTSDAAPAADDIRPRIVRALHEDADIDAHSLSVVVSGNTVTLTGTVRSWHERESAERAATHAPGITHVENLIAVECSAEDEDGRIQDEVC